MGAYVVSNEDNVIKSYGCKHYRRKVKLVSPCCDKVYTCRLCHDEDTDHVLKRYCVEEVVCSSCNHRQPVSRQCANCNTVFGKYFCEECRFYDDDVSKQHFHCKGCGLCRAGGRFNYFHCDKCDLCFPVSLKNNHKCIEKGGRSDCGICLEDIHSARTGSRVLPCGHLLHTPCYAGLVDHHINTCPKCNASIYNRELEWAQKDRQIRRSHIPARFRNSFVPVLCRDCHQRSHAPYHVIGLKCGACGSYNTVEDGPLERRPSQGSVWMRFLGSCVSSQAG